MHAKSHQSCPSLCNTMDCSLPLLSMGFSRQEDQSGSSCSPPGDVPDTGIEPTSLKSPALAARFFTTSATWEEPTLESYHHRNHAVFCARAEPQRDISVKGLLVTPQDIKRLGLDPKHSWLPLSCLAVYLPPTNI